MTKIEWLELAKEQLYHLPNSFEHVDRAIKYINEVIEMIKTEENPKLEGNCKYCGLEFKDFNVICSDLRGHHFIAKEPS